jgi:hypothetical protein
LAKYLYSKVEKSMVLSDYGLLISIFTIIIAQAIALKSMGRSWIASEYDHTLLWYGNHSGPRTSQDLTDPYTFSHVQHGLLFYVLLNTLLFRGKNSATSFVLAVLLECIWEVMENTDGVIRRYRETTAALRYNGDTIVNSVCDTLAMMVGWLASDVLSFHWTVALFCIIEAVMVWKYRDSLLLNVLMLVYPSATIKRWQLYDDNTIRQ